MNKNKEVKVLKLKIFQPTAHYRIPFTFARRHTYPIPPYSTVIGLICNVLGIKSHEDEDFKTLKEGLSLAIYGKYEALNREYIWFRTLNKDAHNKRFGYPENRTVNQMPEHPGGQIPTRIDVLENVNLLIYIKHNNKEFLEKIKNSFENPQKRIYPLHLGRAEDLIVFEEIEIITIKKEPKPLYGILKNYDFTWLVDPERGENFLEPNFYPNNYKEFFNEIKGGSHLITSFYKIDGEIRNFKPLIPVKLFEGGSFSFYLGKPFEFIFDNDIPLFFAKLGG